MTARKFYIVLTIVFFVGLIGISIYNIKDDTGDVSGTSSTRYSEEDIQSAKDTAEAAFNQECAGCELTDLWYDEDYNNKHESSFTDQYGTDEAIVILTNFHVPVDGVDEKLVRNETYTNWQWVLVRNKGEQWRVAANGY